MNAIIFPGQGAQYVGMGKSFYDNFPRAKELFSRIDSASGINLSKKCFEGTEAELKDTAVQQLAILAVSLIGFELFKDTHTNIDIAYFSGLSLGEYSCLYASNVLSLEDTVILVKERACAMQKAAEENPSTMFAVLGANRTILEEKSKEYGFYLANVNSPQQIAISLKKEDKDSLRTVLEQIGMKVIELNVSGGFHSPFMQAAKTHLENVLKKLQFSDAKIPIVSNVTAKAYTEKEEIKANLLDQLVCPVLWNDCAQYMIKNGIQTFFEIGPSCVLKGLMRKINSGVSVRNIEKTEDLSSF